MPHRKVSAGLERRMQLMVEGHRGVLLLHLAWNAQEAPYTAGYVEERHLLRVSVCPGQV